MKNLFLNPVAMGFALLFAAMLSSCGTNEVSDKTAAPDSSSNSITPGDTAMPPEPLTDSSSKADSVTSTARNTAKGEDSIGSKINVHHGKVKVVDTVKRDK